jgi:hypothetical protein
MRFGHLDNLTNRCIKMKDDLSKLKDIETCSNCFSPRIVPYMGYETGKRFICQDCEHISVVTILFEDLESLVKFLQEKRENEKNN